MRIRDLPDISALALGHRAYISGKSLVPMLQLSHVAMVYFLCMVTLDLFCLMTRHHICYKGGHGTHLMNHLYLTNGI